MHNISCARLKSFSSTKTYSLIQDMVNIQSSLTIDSHLSTNRFQDNLEDKVYMRNEKDFPTEEEPEFESHF